MNFVDEFVSDRGLSPIHRYWSEGFLNCRQRRPSSVCSGTAKDSCYNDRITWPHTWHARNGHLVGTNDLRLVRDFTRKKWPCCGSRAVAEFARFSACLQDKSAYSGTESLTTFDTTRIEAIPELAAFGFMVFHSIPFMLKSAEEQGKRNSLFSSALNIPLPPFLCLERCRRDRKSGEFRYDAAAATRPRLPSEVSEDA